MSGLWTPSGEHIPDPGTAGEGDSGSDPSGAGDAGPDEAALAEELRRVREEVLAAPVVDLVARHAVGLWELAALHLGNEDGPRLDDAGLALDAMAGVVETLGDRLGPHAEPLRDALAQLRVAFVQVRDAASGPDVDDEP